MDRAEPLLLLLLLKRGTTTPKGSAGAPKTDNDMVSLMCLKNATGSQAKAYDRVCHDLRLDLAWGLASVHSYSMQTLRTYIDVADMAACADSTHAFGA